MKNSSGSNSGSVNIDDTFLKHFQEIRKLALQNFLQIFEKSFMTTAVCESCTNDDVNIDITTSRILMV